jgi:isocitrate lyase
MLKSAAELKQEWETSPRWKGVTRAYKANDVVRLRGSVDVEHSLARLGAEPFDSTYGAREFHAALRGRRTPIKQLLLGGEVIVGAGNIYA